MDSPSLSSSLTFDSSHNRTNNQTLSFMKAYSQLSAEKNK